MTRTIRSAAVLASVLAGVLVLQACGNADNRDTESASDTRSQSVDLNGAGATFPYPIYSKWFSDYAEDTGIRINYQSIGSGGGIRQLSEQTVDFGASDSPMTDEELAKAKGGPILHIPTVLGAVVVTYNVPGVQSMLNLSADVIADIFLGKITKWNDPRIAQENSDVSLPNQDILVVRRSDGSGTTFIFTDFLTSVSEAWRGGPGRGKDINWPVGLGAKGNEGVAGQVKQIPGAIGYVELAYARQNDLPYAAVKNAAGTYAAPTIESVTAAAAGVVEQLPENTDYRISIVNAAGQDAYPIASFTWILLYQQQHDATKGKKLVDFLHWALTDGQQSAASLDYAPLPANLISALQTRLSSIQ